MRRQLLLFTALAVLCAPALATGILAAPDDSCSLGPPLEGNEVLIGYLTDTEESSDAGVITVGPFRALALLDGKIMYGTHGSRVRDSMPFWPLLESNAQPITLASVTSHHDRFAPDTCVYHARIIPAKLPRWTLLASKALPGLLHAPSDTELAKFRVLNTKCVDQGDHEPEEKIPCVKPQLVAVSDVDGNGKAEYWTTVPYMWDTGFAIQEVGPDGKLVNLVSVCPCCSD